MEDLLYSMIRYAGESYCPAMNAFLQQLLNDAADDVSEYMCPGGSSDTEVREQLREQAISRYPGKIRRIAQYHFDKAGKEGVLRFTENGTSANYESSDTPISFFRGIIPIARVI